MKISRNSICRRIVFFATLCFVASNEAFAQSTYGRISGAVTDSSSAAVRGAKVEVVNEQTQVTRSLETSPEGRYSVGDLDPGKYTVAAGATGFNRTEHKEVTLLARDEIVIDLQLTVASAAPTTVEVVGTPVVSEDLTRFDSKTGDDINSLALNFRATASPSPIVVATLTAGVQEDSGGNITIAGQLPNVTSYSVDGVSTQNVRYGGPNRDLFPSVEGIAEFQVNTAVSNAEFSQPSSITVISRGGTNDFHGGGFWYFQRDAWNSPDQISGVTPLGNANTFGASLGGPVLLPGYNGKNKTFFFFDYEGVRLNSNTAISTNTIPSAWINGDFSGSGVIVNGLNGNPLPGNKVPASQINSTSAYLIPYLFPAATNPETALTAPNLVTSFPGKYTNDGFDGRLDQNFGSNHHLWGHVTQKTVSSIGTDAAIGAGGAGDTTYNPLLGPFSTDEDLTNIAASYSWIIKPNLINELRFGYTRANYTFSYPEALQGNSIVSGAGILGLPGPPKNGLGGVPVVYIGDILGGETNDFGHPRVNKNGIIEIGDIVSWIHGRHTMKFGFEFRHYNYQDNITFNLGDEYGDYFQNGSDAQGFATFLQGRIDDAEQAQNGPDGKPYNSHYGGFAQDEWRILPNFTLTAGLRYEVNTPFNDQTHQLGNFDTSVKGGELVIQNEETNLINPLWRAAVGNTPFVTASQVGLPDTLRYTYYGNIQPRIGVAWSPDSKTSIRSAMGIYSVPVLGAVVYSLLGVDTSYYADYGATMFPDAFPTGANAPTAYPGYRRANPFNLKDPKVIQWNFSIDRAIGWNSVIRASYTGSHTYNLIYSPDLNQVEPNTVGYAALVATPALREQNLLYPNFREVLTRANGPSAKYDAMTLELNRPFSTHLHFYNNYTWAKNITNALGAAPSSAIPTGGQGDNGENANNYFNIAADSGNAYFMPRQRFVSTFVYDLPFGTGQRYLGNIGRAANLAVGGWYVTGVTLAQTGLWLTPYFPSSLSDPSGTFPLSRSVKQQRPDCAAGQTGYLSNPTTADYFNVNAFSVPASDIGRFGNCGVGILEGPGTVTYSMSVGKRFAITERVALQYEAQFANLFNILNKGVPNTDIASSSFGLISQSQAVEQGGPRSIQMMLRLRF